MKFGGPLLASLWLIGATVNHAEGQIFYYHTDHLGSVRMVTDRQGGAVSIQDFLPFGEETAGSENHAWKFTGKWRDDESGRDDFGARFYDGITGRFLSTDSGPPNRADPATWNRYAYVTNNPLRYDDPDGRLKRDRTGQVIFTRQAEGYVGHPGAPGALFRVEFGYVRADDGRKINAFRSIEHADTRMKCDCHGLTFADGKFWINNDQVDKILKGDHYQKVKRPQVGDIAIYRDGSGVVHSVTITGVDKDGKVTEVSGLGGIERKAHANQPEPGPGGGWRDPRAQVEYWHKVDDTRSIEERRKDAERIKAYEKN